MSVLEQLITKLPKTELHLHIEGTLEPEMVMALAARNGISMPYATSQELAAKYEFGNLQEFLDLYYQATAVLVVEQDFYDLTWAYLLRCQEDNVVHTEIFFDPQSHTDRGVSFETVVKGITRALEDAREKLNIESKLIMCFLRHLPESSALATWEEAQPWLSLIDGVGLDSSERDFPPSLFERVFAKAREKGLKVVAHAGEEGPSDYIVQALDLLQVDRIDHGVRITEDDALMDRVAQEKVALTVCPLSNTKLCVYDDMAKHPIFTLLDRGLRVMVNSDDPAYFGGYVNENYRALVTSLNPSSEQIIQLVRNSILASFMSDELKAHWLEEVSKTAEQVLGE
ncbi:adenosine deaminase [Marinibactrum halimedae]|uniref:Adenine deaminase n=1 Tax=Marinibactrum halimedae TaxID=1444977 RepID=A0AA37T5M7_9GAMM|nr:adenosine deaminase [Marinibactrum halimedae]MCD9459682.1 adenosine deaminase [Marinibactrum halimedae]GLS25708.1 adenine deaminase [Marinibactrum halimedae]